MDWIEGRHLRPYLKTAPSQAERDRAGELLVRAMLRLWYRARLVYADPHPGNFLFMPDGRLGLIDLGCCHRFSEDEYEYCAQMERASFGSRDELRRAWANAAGVEEVDQLDPAYEEILEELCEWLWVAIRTEEEFDFSDRSHFQEGAEIMRKVIEGRHFRSRTVNVWLNRLFFGTRAILTQLGSRLRYGEVMRSESDVVREIPEGWTPN